MSEVSKSSSVTYRPIESLDPKYTFTRLYQQTGSASVTIPVGGASGSEIVFEIPAKVHNLSRSELSFTLNFITPGAVVATSNAFIYDYVCSFFTQVQLYTRSGLYLMDYRYADYANAITGKACKSMADYLTNDQPSTLGLARSDAISTSTLRPNGATLNPNYTDFNYFQGVALPVGPATTLHGNFKIPLSDLCPESILAVDKDLYFGGEVVLLRFVLNSYANISWLVTALTNPHTGAAVGTSDIQLNPLSLRLAVEQEPMIVDSIVQKCKEAGGMNVIVPVATVYRQVVNAGNNQIVTLRLNRSHGSHLLRCYYTNILTANGTGAGNSDLHYLPFRPTTYYTALENLRIQQFDLTTAENDDFEYVRDFLSETCIQNVSMYSVNWFHVDDFTGKKFIKDRDEIYKRNILCGLPLDKEYKYDVNITTPADANSKDHYIVAIGLKNLNVSPAGISLV